MDSIFVRREGSKFNGRSLLKLCSIEYSSLRVPPLNGKGYVFVPDPLAVCLLAASRKNGWMAFMQGYMVQDKKNNLENSRDILDHHQDSELMSLLEILRKTYKISRIGRAWHFEQSKIFLRMFSAWLDRFTLFKLGAAQVCPIGVLFVM